MPRDWWSVDLILAVLTVVLLASVAGAAYMTASESDLDVLLAGPAICFLPVSIALSVFSLAVIGSFLPYRGSGRRMFPASLERVTGGVEAHLEEQGLRYEKDDRVERVRRAREHRVTYTLTLEGRDVSVLVRGMEQGPSTPVFIRPWSTDEGLSAFVDGLERAVLGRK